MSSHGRAAVAMSGGVDSSVAALLLHRAGYDCLGISMQVWDYRSNGGCDTRATCCSPDDFTDARKVAASIGIPYYVFDFEESFREKVIDNFVASYERGLTPNPCVDCNSKVKFRELRERAAGFSCDYVATGHYARIEKNGAELELRRGADRDKDQSYFLYGITREQLARTLFPVGHMNKSEVREIAKEAGLATADKSESQDICFVSGTVQEFLSQNGGRVRAGTIQHKNGEVLGSHAGVQNYTVGQRRGLRVGGASSALYVIDLQAESNTVVVGEKSDLERGEFIVEELSWLSSESAKQLAAGSEVECFVQVRSRDPGASAVLKQSASGSVSVRYTGRSAVVSPGQAAVFYDLGNEIVLGGGRIARFE